MLGEVTCIAKPLATIPIIVSAVIIPMVVSRDQDVIASGQVRPTDQLVDIQQPAQPGTITVLMELRRGARSVPDYAYRHVLKDLLEAGSGVAEPAGTVQPGPDELDDFRRASELGMAA